MEPVLSFLHNTDPKKPVKGKARLIPGKLDRPAEPMYNINQHGEKVLIAASEAGGDKMMTVNPMDVDL